MSEDGEQPQEPVAPKFNYEEKDEKNFFKKQEKIIFDAYMTAKRKKEADQPDEETKEPFNVDEWVTQFVEETKHDDKIVKYVVTLGIYGGNRNEHNQRTGEGESLFPNGDRYTGGFSQNLRHGQGLYVFGSQSKKLMDEAIDTIKSGTDSTVFDENSISDLFKTKKQQLKNAFLEICKKKNSKLYKTLEKNRFVDNMIPFPTSIYFFYSLKYSTYPFYCGKSVNNAKEGYGIMKYANGSVYVGEWKDNKKHGKGKAYFANGDVYDGEFADGLRNGRGTYAFSSGDSVYEGVFEKGNMKSGVWKMGDGVSYEGNYEDNFPQDESGDASFTFPRQQDFPAVGKMSDGFFQTNYF